MTYENKDIIDALRSARKARGLSQRALGEKAGVPQSHISRIENNAADLQLSSLIQLARALGMELKLIPRKALPAVETVVRSVSAPPPSSAASSRQAFPDIASSSGTFWGAARAYTLEDDDE